MDRSQRWDPKMLSGPGLESRPRRLLKHLESSKKQVLHKNRFPVVISVVSAPANLPVNNRSVFLRTVSDLPNFRTSLNYVLICPVNQAILSRLE